MLHLAEEGKNIKIIIKSDGLPEEDNRNKMALYTDGSKLADKVGAAFVAIYKEEEIHNSTYKLNSNNSVFQAEQLALLKAWTWAYKNTEETINIYSDSASTLQSMAQFQTEDEQSQKLKIKIARSSRPTMISWVRSHIGTAGNERADALAKQATETGTPIMLKWPRSKLKALLSEELLNEWQQSWMASTDGRNLYNYCKKVKQNKDVQISRSTTIMLSGHGPFPSYLQDRTINENPFCVCGAIGDSEHYLFSCELTARWHLKKPNEQNMSHWLKTLEHKTIRQKLSAMVAFLEGTDVGLP